MNAGYRAAAAAPTVTLGPLPPRPAHFILPAVLGALGLFVSIGDVLATLPSPEVLLRCKRTPVYGAETASDAIGSWEVFDGVGELEPFAAQLRHLFDSVPRA